MMVIFLLTVSVMFFYSGSKHFPIAIPDKYSMPSYFHNLAGGGMSIFGILLLNQTMDIVTAFVLALIVLMTVLPMLIFSLSIYPNSWKSWTAVILIIALIDIARYAS